MKTVFLSYARNDAHFAEEIERAFRPGGFRAWRFQSDMVGGKPWNPQLPFNIEACDIFLLATTDNSLDSETCEKEWQHAALKQKPMVTVVVERGVFPPAPLDDHQWVTFDGTAVSGAGLINALQNAQPLRWDMIPDDWTTWDGKTKTELMSEGTRFSDIPIPTLHRELSDLDKEDFLHESIGEIRAYFERALNAFEKSDSRVQIQIRNTSDSELSCQIYLNDNVKKGCRIWIYNQCGFNGIAYYKSDGRTAIFGKHPCNELATVAELDGKPALKFTLGLGMFTQFDGCKICTVDKAAECLWKDFVRDFNEISTYW